MKKGILSLGAGLILSCTMCTAQTLQWGGLNYRLLSEIDSTVAVGNNRHCTMEKVVIPGEIHFLGKDYQVVSIADSAFLPAGDHEGPSQVVIGEGIRSIGKEAFAQCYNLTEVSLPTGLQVIGDQAFDGCEGLADLQLPEGLEHIGESAFAQCHFSTFQAPSTLKSIGDYAFYKKGLKSVKLNEGLESIGDFAFANNIALSSCSLPCSVQEVGKGAFTITGVQFLVVPETWKVIPDQAFEDCPELTELTLCEGVEQIGERAFASCGQLRSITLPQSLQRVGREAFDLTNLRLITILNPHTVFEEGALQVPSVDYSRFVSGMSDHLEVATIGPKGQIEIHGEGIADLTVVVEDPESGKQRTIKCYLRVGVDESRMGLDQYLEMEGL